MIVYMIKKTLVIFIFVQNAWSIPINQDPNEYQKIKCLLEAVERSNGVFIRNGSKHTSLMARQHLESKYNKATKTSWPFRKAKKVSAQQFIEKLASRSSFSGKNYQIIVGQKTLTTGQWLREQLSQRCH